MCQNCNRRDFLSVSATGGLVLAANTHHIVMGQTMRTPTATMPSKVPICVVFAGNPGEPGRGWYLTEEDRVEIEGQLKRIEEKLGNVELIVGRASNANAMTELLQEAGDEAPVLVINMTIGGLLSVMPPVFEQNRPTAVFSMPGSGHDWLYPFRWREEGRPVTLIASADYNDLEEAIKLLRVIPMMKHTRVLLLPNAAGTDPACTPELVKQKLGAEIVVVPHQRFDDMITAVDEDSIEKETQRWLDEAHRVHEPNREDIAKAARVSIALERLVEEEKAQAVTIGDCLGWLQRGFPCLGFTRLRDIGVPAVCEGDMDSLWTMVMFQYATDLPGFQGNSTFDTSKNQVWTAHCVGPLKMDGLDAPSAPYLLRSHSEVGDGVVPEIFYRIGQKITRAKFVNLDTMLVSTGTICDVPEKSVRACRTQIVTEVDDAAAMARKWGGGVLTGDMRHEMMTLLHRVVYYGDHIQRMKHLGDLMGFQVVEEA